MQTTLVKAWLIVLGMGMGILCVAGLASHEGASWLTWLDLAGAAISISLAAMMKPLIGHRKLDGSIVALSIGVFALWLIGLAVHALPMLVWWNFAFAVAFLIVGIASLSKKEAKENVSHVSPRHAA